MPTTKHEVLNMLYEAYGFESIKPNRLWNVNSIDINLWRAHGKSLRAKQCPTPQELRRIITLFRLLGVEVKDDETNSDRRTI